MGTRLPMSTRSLPAAFALSVSDPPPWKIWISFARIAAIPVELVVMRRSASIAFFAKMPLSTAYQTGSIPS
jgi:hypothetical protein